MLLFFFLKQRMDKREAIKPKTLLIFWNTCLVVFSIHSPYIFFFPFSLFFHPLLLPPSFPPLHHPLPNSFSVFYSLLLSIPPPHLTSSHLSFYCTSPSFLPFLSYPILPLFHMKRILRETLGGLENPNDLATLCRSRRSTLNTLLRECEA